MPSTITDRLNGLTTSVAVKAPCRVATTANITLSGEQTIDGVAVVAGDRVLVKSQTTTTENGIYVAAASTWSRTADFDGSLDVVVGTLAFVAEGTTNGLRFFRLSATSPVTIGTTNLSWVSVGGSLTDYAPPVQTYGAVGDGVTDDTAAITTALAANDHLYFPAGTYLITQIEIAAGKRISTDGFDTKFKQASGTATATPLIKITGSNVTLESCQVEGQLNQAGDTTGEFNHGIHVALVTASAASITNVSIGDVKGTNIRGDVVYIGSNATAYAAGYRVSQVSVGHVYGSNVLRNVVSVTGGSGISIASVDGVEVGFMHFDIEPDAGVGPVIGVRVGYVKGCYAGVVPTDDEVYADGVEIGTLDLDPAYTTGSTPAYAPGASLEHALEIRNTKSLKIGKFKANGFNGQAIKQTYNVGELAKQYVHIGHAELTDCCKTEATNLCYLLGGTGVTVLSIDNLVATTTLSTHRVMLNCDNHRVGVANVTLVSGSSYARGCAEGVTEIANITGGTALISCTDTHVNGGTQNGEYLFNFCTRCKAHNSTITASTNYDNSGTDNLVFNSRIGGTFHHVWSNSDSWMVTAAGKVISWDGIRSRSATAGMGYESGAGGTVTQATSKSTGVTLNKATGQITLSAAALAADTTVSFTLTNSAIAATDMLILNHLSGGTAGAYTLNAQCAAGSASINVRNVTAGSLSEAIVISFAVFKGATA